MPYSDNYGRDVIEEWVHRYFAESRSLAVLDIACGEGDDLRIVRQTVPAAILYGLDIQQESVLRCSSFGVVARRTNLEIQPIPFPDDMFDLVIANQVMEHLKNWVPAVAEIARVLKPNGLLIIGVPNLASLHNRLMLMLGRQPTCIDTTGMHVRGFTYGGLAAVLEYRQLFQIIDCQGRVVFPFPRKQGLFISKRFPTAASSLFVLCRRVGHASSLAALEAMRRRDESAID